MVHLDRIARHLFAQRSIGSCDNHTRRGLQQGAFHRSYLVTIKDIDSAVLEQALFTVHFADQAEEYPIQFRAVISLLAIEDYYIHHESAAAQVFVHQQDFAYQVDLFGIVQLYQQDGIVAGDTKAPQPGLTEPAGCHRFRRSGNCLD